MSLAVTTLPEVVAEFRRAGMAVDEHNDALCPVCRHLVEISDGGAGVELTCTNGCTQEAIGHALHFLSERPRSDSGITMEVSSWEPVDLLPFLTGEHIDEQTEILHRADGIGLLYPGRLHAVYGEPEACKGWLALAAAVECMEAGEPVVYLDYEDQPGNIVSRLLALGVDPAVIRARLAYVRVDEP